MQFNLCIRYVYSVSYIDYFRCSVTRRSQRALTAEEIALNCEKSINFFKISKEVNAAVETEQKRGGGWSKLRRKMLKI